MPSATASGAEPSPNGNATSRDHNQGNQDRKYTVEQKTAVVRVRKCAPTAFYDILGLEEVRSTCTDAEIKKAYRKLSLLTHPDKNGYDGADEAFKRKRISSVECLVYMLTVLCRAKWSRGLFRSSRTRRRRANTIDMAETPITDSDLVQRRRHHLLLVLAVLQAHHGRDRCGKRRFRQKRCSIGSLAAAAWAEDSGHLV